MNAYCRRAVSKGVELARETGGTCTVFTLGPPPAEDALREAIAWGADAGSSSPTRLSPAATRSRRRGRWPRPWSAGPVRSDPFRTQLGRRRYRPGRAVGRRAARPAVPGRGQGARDRRREVSATCEQDDRMIEARTSLPACCRAPSGCASRPRWRPRGVQRSPLTGSNGCRPPTWGLARGDSSVARPWSASFASMTTAARAVRPRNRRASRSASRSKCSTRPGCSGRAPHNIGRFHRGGRSAQRRGPAIGVLIEPGRLRVSWELLGAAAGLAAELGGRVVALGT